MLLNPESKQCKSLVAISQRIRTMPCNNILKEVSSLRRILCKEAQGQGRAIPHLSPPHLPGRTSPFPRQPRPRYRRGSPHWCPRWVSLQGRTEIDTPYALQHMYALQVHITHMAQHMAVRASVFISNTETFEENVKAIGNFFTFLAFLEGETQPHLSVPVLT